MSRFYRVFSIVVVAALAVLGLRAVAQEAPNADRVVPEDFKYAQPQSTYQHAEIEYLSELIPGARF